MGQAIETVGQRAASKGMSLEDYVNQWMQEVARDSEWFESNKHLAEKKVFEEITLTAYLRFVSKALRIKEEHELLLAFHKEWTCLINEGSEALMDGQL